MMTDTPVAEPQDEEDRLPWLEAADEDDERSGPSLGKVIGLVIVGIVLLGVIVGGYSWWAQRGATGSGSGEMIAAPAEPYKVQPDEPGGMNVEGEGDTAFAASEGVEPEGKIDTAAVPEAPMIPAQPKAKAAAQPPERAPAPAPSPAPAAPAQAGAGGATIQLGAFSSEAAANNAWKALSGRFGYLEPLAYSVVPVKTGDRTLYRLRANGAGAANICDRLRIAGESCVSVN
jgi:hypothetical protein